MRYQNPILKSFHPDPSICRVGDTFYLATSSFSYFPGIPIYKSRDLIHWTLVGNAITREEQLPLMEATASGGIWAPTIRYEGGVFYITATFSEKGNFIVTSADVEKGFSDPIWVDMVTLWRIPMETGGWCILGRDHLFPPFPIWGGRPSLCL